jgi:hypothetical protein
VPLWVIGLAQVCVKHLLSACLRSWVRPFTRNPISPIEVVGCVTFPQEPAQSGSTNRAFAERRGAVR